MPEEQPHQERHRNWGALVLGLGAVAIGAVAFSAASLEVVTNRSPLHDLLLGVAAVGIVAGTIITNAFRREFH